MNQEITTELNALKHVYVNAEGTLTLKDKNGFLKALQKQYNLSTPSITAFEDEAETEFIINEINESQLRIYDPYGKNFTLKDYEEFFTATQKYLNPEESYIEITDESNFKNTYIIVPYKGGIHISKGKIIYPDNPYRIV